MTDDHPVSPARVRKHRHLTPVWFLPLIALVIVGWLAWRTLEQSGLEVQVRFIDGRGIKVGKTEVLHKGIAIGRVTGLAPSEDLEAVDVSIEMNVRFEELLTESSAFWLVKPQVSFAGVSGLDTLVSGNYIAFSPSASGKKQSSFVALAEAPSLVDKQDGLRLTLRARELSSVEEGSPVYYRKLKVGEVFAYDLSKDGQSVEVQVFIRSRFAHLVRGNTRFWNAGGVHVSGNLSNLKVRTQSLVSLLQGGIAFYTPEWETASAPARDGQSFALYPDYEEAEVGIPITIEFPLEVSLGEHSMPIRFHGFEVGRIRAIDVSEDMNRIVAEASIRPEVRPMLVEGARFWVVEPKLGLQGVTGLDTLLGGRYVAMDVSKKDLDKGQEKRLFKGTNQRPAAPLTASGLHLSLRAESLWGITVGSPILFHNVPVGTVQSYEVRPEGVEVYGLIEARYRHLVNNSSRFWNVSGLSFEGSLSSFKIRTGTLSTLISGGIAFRTDSPGGKKASNGDRFTLYRDEKDPFEDGLPIDIYFEKADGLQEGTRIRFRGVDVGRLTGVDLDAAGKGVIARALLDMDKAWLAREGTRFWRVGPTLGLAGSANLDTLLKGSYINLTIAEKPGPSRKRFIGQRKEPDDLPRSSGLVLKLVSDRLGSIRRGNPVYYREIPVGEVTGYRLANPASQVIIVINIEERYQSL
ncbi:MAG: MlaD family protein, partial [Endozoicomonas sp.]